MLMALNKNIFLGISGNDGRLSWFHVKAIDKYRKRRTKDPEEKEEQEKYRKKTKQFIEIDDIQKRKVNNLETRRQSRWRVLAVDDLRQDHRNRCILRPPLFTLISRDAVWRPADQVCILIPKLLWLPSPYTSCTQHAICFRRCHSYRYRVASHNPPVPEVITDCYRFYPRDEEMLMMSPLQNFWRIHAKYNFKHSVGIS